MNKIDIRIYSLEELQNIITSLSEPKFKAKQIYQWLWQKGVTDFDAMSNLSKGLRQKLKEQYTFNTLSKVKEQRSNDGTIKTAWQLHDGNIIESVLIPVPEDKRFTLCISSQVGCSLNCKFCATGKLKTVRDLLNYEIFEQFVRINNLCEEEFGNKLTNLVYMGMGEPLLNYNNVMDSIHKITSPEGLGFSTKRITLSTSGIVKGIKKLTEDNFKSNIALSLHAADNQKRNKIMPFNKTNSIEDIMAALKEMYLKNKNKIGFEYILFKDFNDSFEDANNLIKLSKHFPVKINIISYNYVEGVQLQKATTERTNKFAKYLVDHGVMTTVRKSRGDDIDAACGQLASKAKRES